MRIEDQKLLCQKWKVICLDQPSSSKLGILAAMNPPMQNDDFHSEHMRAFDRWRTAIELVRLLREVGIDCDLDDRRQTSN